MDERHAMLYDLARAQICIHKAASMKEHSEGQEEQNSKPRRNFVAEAVFPLGQILDDCAIQLVELYPIFKSALDHGTQPQPTSDGEIAKACAELQGLCRGLSIPFHAQDLLNQVLEPDLGAANLTQLQQFIDAVERLIGEVDRGDDVSADTQRDLRKLSQLYENTALCLREHLGDDEERQALQKIVDGIDHFTALRREAPNSSIEAIYKWPGTFDSISQGLYLLDDLDPEYSLALHPRFPEALVQLEQTLMRATHCFMLRGTAHEMTASHLTSKNRLLAENRMQRLFDAYRDYSTAGVILKNQARHLAGRATKGDLPCYPFALETLVADSSSEGPQIQELGMGTLYPVSQQALGRLRNSMRTGVLTQSAIHFLSGQAGENSPLQIFDRGLWLYQQKSSDAPEKRYTAAQENMERAYQALLETEKEKVRGDWNITALDEVRMRFQLELAIIRRRVAEFVAKSQAYEERAEANKALSALNRAVKDEQRTVEVYTRFRASALCKLLRQIIRRITQKNFNTTKLQKLLEKSWPTKPDELHDLVFRNTPLSHIGQSEDKVWQEIREQFTAIDKLREANNLQALYVKLAQLNAAKGDYRRANDCYMKATSARDTYDDRQDFKFSTTVMQSALAGQSTYGSGSSSRYTPYFGEGAKKRKAVSFAGLGGLDAESDSSDSDE
jgi:tetratricopeptide (TPR) repeat protein